jgi:hypothetical protein
MSVLVVVAASAVLISAFARWSLVAICTIAALNSTSAARRSVALTIISLLLGRQRSGGGSTVPPEPVSRSGVTPRP